ncbi:Serine/threonine protein kinase-related domain protein [Rhodopirellula sallentina SM41]|uniref:Serine/threonine protein kinase-related domain protein n=1 Tax=Rhodopirellula sallentina SM41 TaxID=1263870 RepID=M5UE02_9BACT|nr:Serine/threonine protein kinase-related domain protein [Rhodopirellula sallentina SM41]
MPGYTLVRRLGAGFSGQVWVARAAGGTEVALKVVELHKIGGRKELKALRTIRNVRHPNLCPVHSFWVRDSSGRLLRDDETETLDPDNEHLKTSPVPISNPSRGWTPDSPPEISLTETQAFDVRENLDESESSVESADTTEKDPLYETIVPGQGIVRPGDPHDESADAADSDPDIDPMATHVTLSGQQPSRRTSFAMGGDVQHTDPTHAEELIIVMGLGDRTLNDRLQEVRRENRVNKNAAVVCGLDAKEAIRYLRSSAQAIDALTQQHGILHGDIKPQNILLVGGEAQVCDFGLANKIEGDVRFTNQTFASPAYGAPEVLDGQTYSKTGDQYSLAVTYFELRTGLLPFDATTALKILSQKANEAFDMQSLPAPQRKVLRRAMRSDPNARYRSCVEFVDALAVAAGVDQPSGLNPVWVGVGGVILAIVIAGGVAAFLPSAGKSPEQIYAEADSEWKKYSPQQSYSQSRYPLKRCLDKLTEGIAADWKTSEKQRFYSLAVQSSSALADEILDELETPRFDEKGQLQLSSLISDDLGGLQSGLGTGKNALVKEGSPEGQLLQTDLDLARLELAALTRVPDHRPGDDVVSRIRETLTTWLAGDSIPEVAESDVVTSTAVAVALTHHVDDPAGRHFVQPAALGDIIRAEQALRQSDGTGVPVWMMSQWNMMRDGENGFLAQIEQAFREQSVDSEASELIATTWPSISVDASITRLKRDAEQKNWRSFLDQYRELQREKSRSTIADPDLMLQFAFIETMAEGLGVESLGVEGMEGDDGLEFLNTAKEQLGAISASWRTSMQNAIMNWVEEIVSRSKANQASLAVAQAEAVWKTGTAIGKYVGLPATDALDEYVVVAALSDNATTASDSELAKASADRLSRKRHPLSMLFRSETSAFSGRPLGRSGGIRLKQVLSQTDVCDDFPNQIRPVLRNYQLILADWHQGEAGAVLDGIAKLQSQTRQARERLGPARCRWIAKTLVKAEFDRIGIRKNDFFVATLPTTSNGDFTEHIRWWLENAGASANEARVSVDLLATYSAVIEKRSAKLSPSLHSRLADLIEVSEDGRTVQPLSAQDRLLLRVAFEIDRPATPDGTDVGLEVDVDPVRRMVGAAARMLDTDLGLRRPTQAWVRNVIAPTTHRVMSVVRRSSAEPGGWMIPPELNSDSLHRFSRHANRADEFTTLGDVLGRLSQNEQDEGVNGALLQIDALEFFAAVAGDDGARSADDRFASWIDAAEYYQEQLERREETWTGTNLRQFATYIKRAERIRPSSNLVAILKSFALYHQSRMRLANNQIDHLDLEKSADALGRAIRRASDEPASNALFCVCWRHANVLVNLAFLQPVSQKYETLMAARTSALRATEMIGELPATTLTNPAYLALGNACEDLAYYCRFLDDDTRTRYFQEAIANFSEAVGKTEWGESILPRFSLVRCRQRFVESGLAGTEQLRTAMTDLGKPDPEAPKILQVEWLGWRARLFAELGERDQAIRDVARAYEMLPQSDTSDGMKHKREEVEYMYADILATSQSRAERERAVELLNAALKSNVPVTAWKAFVLRCRIFNSIGEDDRLAETILAMPVEKLIEQIKRDPILVSQQLAEISFYVNRSGSTISFGRPPRLSPGIATRCLKQIASAVNTARQEVDQDDLVDSYADLIVANTETIGEERLSRRVQLHLAALDSAVNAGIDPIIRSDAWRCVIRQFLPVFRPSAGFSEEARSHLIAELPLISSADREKLQNVIDNLQRADTPPTDDERYVMSTVEQVMPQIKPVD